jgi:flagellar biosynthesis/type III secretory pathway protein FliH
MLDEMQQSSDYQRGYQEGYQTGYDRGLQVAYQWMITNILEQMQMAGIPLDPLEGPKIKQAVDALTPQIGDLE